MFLTCVLPVLMTLSCSSSAQRSDDARDACAIAALPQKPGSDFGGPDAGAKMKALEGTRWVSPPGPRPNEARADWEPCLDGSGFETFEFSPDRRFARAYGGWQATPLAGAWGECYYEKLGDGWRTIACIVTAVS